MWIRGAIAAGETLTVDDVTEDYCVLGVYGPRARALLSTVAGRDFSDEAMPSGWATQGEVAGQPVIFMRTAYTGEVGWELCVDCCSRPTFVVASTAG
jgi:glycine cleavage system aminomethyltransferase T